MSHSDSVPDSSSSPEVDQRPLAAYLEPLSGAVRRGFLIGIPTVGLAILIGWAMGPSEAGGLLIVLAFMAGGVVFHRYGARRALILRVDDLFTRGGAIDQPIFWQDLATATNKEGSVVTLTTHGGRTTHLSLAPFSRDDQIIAIDVILRTVEIWQQGGALLLPPADNLRWATRRLELRSLTAEDEERIDKLREDEVLRRQQLAVDYSPAIESEIFSRQLEYQKWAPGWYGFALRLDRETIGLIQIWLDQDFVIRQGCIGFNLAPEFRNQGYTTEALRSVVAFAQGQTSLQTLTASCFSDNLACRRVLEKSGFTRSGEFPRFRLKDGEWKTAIRYDLVLEREAKG